MSQSTVQETKNKVGQWTSTSLVLGNMVGSGIFLLPAALGAYGGISIIGWIISSLGALLLAKVFASLSRMIPYSGGPYVYTRVGFGDFSAFLVAWGYWISILCTNAAITVAMLGYLAVFFPILEETPLLSITIGVGVIWLLTWVNNRGIKSAGYLQLVTTILKIIPLLLITIVGLFFFHAEHFIPFNISASSSWDAILQTTTLTLFAYLGVECATIPAEQVNDAKVTIPRATWIGTILAILIYMLGSISIMGVLSPEELQASSAPFADAANLIWGSGARYFVALGAVISTFGALNGWIMMQGQIPMAAARDNVFPSFFAKTNESATPVAGIILSSVLVTLLLITNYTKGLNKAFEFMILLSTLTVLVPYLFSSATYMIMANKKGVKLYRNWSIWLGLGAFCFSLFAVIGSGQEVVFYGFIMLMIGIPFYVLIKLKNDKNGNNKSQ
ncbi:MAG: APA family basic amino acid/polyamine antiporter [Saprospiraceae bacterium]|jgi:APA family basic amino acid/polyamine antiporter